MINEPTKILLRCPECLAVFRTEFACCPVDGAELDPFTADDDPLIGGEIAGRYVAEALVGEGSMGLVYRARHARLPRPFAIKILFGDLVAHARMRMRFAQEAALASRLNHRNVVPVVDFGRSERGLLYLVMDYVEGEALSDLIEREAPLDPLLVCHLARQLADGLGHAHEHGLVHRDFKPSNVVLEWRDDGPPVPRILDFGLAISTREPDDTPGRLTELGFIVGTPIYIAPEQALDRAVDHRADLFALGVVMYEMLTGRPPFDGRPVEVAHKNVSHSPPPMAQRTPGLAVAPDLERLVRRLLEKSPDQRFASAADLCAALDAVEHRAAGRSALGTGVDALTWADDQTPPDEEPAELSSFALPGMQRRRLAAAGAVLGVCAVLTYGLVRGAGANGATRREAPAQTAAAPEPSVAPLTVEPAPPAVPAPPPVVAPLAAPESTEERAQARPASSRARTRHLARERARERERDGEMEDAREAETEDEAARQEAALAELASPAEEPDPEPAEPPDSAVAGAMGAGEEPAAAPARPAAPVRPAAAPNAARSAPAGAPEGAEVSVSQLVRDYREVGEAIDRLEAQQGDLAAQRYRERYFRLPYGDALRISSMRRDTLAALAGLRREVMQAIASPAR